MIQIKNLTKSFGEGEKRLVVLDEFNAEFERGKVTSILGGSGSGKSTLLKNIIGAQQPDSGEIIIDGQEVTHLKKDKLNTVRKKLGIIFQNGALFNSLSVKDNVALPLREHTNLNESTIGIMVKMKLEMVGLRGAEDLMPCQLSGGMIKRIALARALALDPRVVLYDEPSAGLDPIAVGVIDKLIKDLSQKMGLTSIVVTHTISSAMNISDKIILLFQGKVIASGAPDEIRQSEDERVVQFINGNADGPIPFSRSLKDYGDELKEMSLL